MIIIYMSRAEDDAHKTDRSSIIVARLCIVNEDTETEGACARVLVEQWKWHRCASRVFCVLSHKLSIQKKHIPPQRMWVRSRNLSSAECRSEVFAIWNHSCVWLTTCALSAWWFYVLWFVQYIAISTIHPLKSAEEHNDSTENREHLTRNTKHMFCSRALYQRTRVPQQTVRANFPRQL